MSTHAPRPDATPNRLLHETSPYLLQHAYNPVDWHPWGEEAFRIAQERDQPVFLSVGYSACHWCHVMERESFENAEIAAVMNANFVNVKVDREERPDVDQVYMAAVQLMTQRGGWPMSVFMTPAGEPFFGGTYFPPQSRQGMRGFKELLELLADYWKNKRGDVLKSAADLVGAISRVTAPTFDEEALTVDTLRTACDSLVRSADMRHGGFGGAPKFPHPMDLRVLLRVSQRFNRKDALDAVLLTLDKMAAGGIYDQLGGGFHRYSTDAHWLAPHFEKMLYDNALLVPAYLEAYQLTKNPDYARVVRETLDYVLREMTQPQGGFYATQDADSEGEEGKFFVWTEDEIVAVLGPEDARTFCYCYDVTTRGNWEGHNILNRPKPHAAAAKMLGIDETVLASTLAACREKLLQVRAARIAPGRDDKVLTAWNGMMISACALASQVLSEPRYLVASEAAAEFVLTHMRDTEQPGSASNQESGGNLELRSAQRTLRGRLLHSYKDDRARFAAYLDDYACFANACVDLYESTFEPRWLREALVIVQQMLAHFSDAATGTLFFTADDQEQLITRVKDTQDNATPSGNSVAALVLLRLGRLCGRSDLEERGFSILNAMSSLLNEHPRAAGQAILALDFHLGPTTEIVIAAGTDESATLQMITDLRQRFLPRAVLALRPSGVTEAALPGELSALLHGKSNSTETRRPLLHACERGACQLPVQSVAEMP